MYTNQWAVKILDCQSDQADAIASKYGFRNLGPVSLRKKCAIISAFLTQIIPGGDYFLFESRVIRKRSLRKLRRHLHPPIEREHNVFYFSSEHYSHIPLTWEEQRTILVIG